MEPTNHHSFAFFPDPEEFFLITHFPQPKELSAQILEPLDKWSWWAFYSAVAASLFLGLVTGNEDLDVTKLVLHSTLQIVQPAELRTDGASGKVVFTVLMLIAFYWHTLYDIFLRSFIIGQEFPQVADSMEDIDLSLQAIHSLDQGILDGSWNKKRIMDLWYYDRMRYCLLHKTEERGPTSHIFGHNGIFTYQGAFAIGNTNVYDVHDFSCYINSVIHAKSVAILSR